MKFDNESETKGLSSFICFLIVILLVCGWTFLVHSGILSEIIIWLKGVQ